MLFNLHVSHPIQLCLLIKLGLHTFDVLFFKQPHRFQGLPKGILETNGPPCPPHIKRPD